MQIRGTPAIYFKSLNRSFTVMGVERQLFFLFVGLCLPIAFSARLGLKMDVVAAGLFLILYSIGVLVTRLDQQMLALYRRHISYKKYYAYNPGIHARMPLLRPSVPIYEGQRGLV